LSIDGATEKTSSAKVRKLLNYTVYICFDSRAHTGNSIVIGRASPIK